MTRILVAERAPRIRGAEVDEWLRAARFARGLMAPGTRTIAPGAHPRRSLRLDLVEGRRVIGAYGFVELATGDLLRAGSGRPPRPIGTPVGNVRDFDPAVVGLAGLITPTGP